MAIYNYCQCNNCKLKNNILICNDCNACICLYCINKFNHTCIKTKCNIKKLSNKCQNNHYDMINNKIAVGDCYSSYDDFNVIVNLFGEFNGCKSDQVILVEENNKKIYKVGLIDKSEYKDDALIFINFLIPRLMNDKDEKILFHCHSGVSRSATFAIAYLIKMYKLTKDEALNLVKSKRSIINPNYGFMKILDEI